MFPHTFPIPHFLSFPHHSLIASHLIDLSTNYLSPALLLLQSVTFSWGGSICKGWFRTFIIDIELHFDLYLTLSLFKQTFNELYNFLGLLFSRAISALALALFCCALN